MAKKKEVTVKDVLMKLEKSFKEVVVLNHLYFCSTDRGESECAGYYFGRFTKEVRDLLFEKYPAPLIEFSPIKDAKASLDTPQEEKYIYQNRSDTDLIIYSKKFHEYYERVEHVEEWSLLPLSEEDLEKLLTDNEVISCKFEGIDDEIQISKSLLPGITVKSISQLTYCTQSTQMFDYLFIHQPVEYYDLYMMYTFMKG